MQNRSSDRVPGGRGILFAVCVIGFLLGTVVGKAQSPNAVTQLTPSANKRYLVDQNDRPFLMQGDAAWSLIVGLSDAEEERYLKDRRQKGFNTVLVELIEHKFCKHPPLDRAGDAPFTTPGDFSTLDFSAGNCDFASAITRGR